MVCEKRLPFIIFAFKNPCGRFDDDDKMTEVPVHVFAQVNVHLCQRIIWKIQGKRFIFNKPARHFWRSIGLLPVAQVLFVCRPVCGLNGIDLQVEFFVIDGIYRKNWLWKQSGQGSGSFVPC